MPTASSSRNFSKEMLRSSKSFGLIKLGLQYETMFHIDRKRVCIHRIAAFILIDDQSKRLFAHHI